MQSYKWKYILLIRARYWQNFEIDHTKLMDKKAGKAIYERFYVIKNDYGYFRNAFVLKM